MSLMSKMSNITKIDTDNEGKAKTEDNILYHPNIPVDKEEKLGEVNLQEAETDENEPKTKSACKLAKKELLPFLYHILKKQYTYDSSKMRKHQYSNELRTPEYANFVAMQSTGSRGRFFNSTSILKIGDETASDDLMALTEA